VNKMSMEEAFGSLKAHEELLKGQEEEGEEEKLLMTTLQESGDMPTAAGPRRSTASPSAHGTPTVPLGVAPQGRSASAEHR
jgi:hypothetical protein